MQCLLVLGLSFQPFSCTAGTAELSSCFLLSFQVMFSACELGVFDLLRESKESLSSKVIAESLGTSIHGAERLLDACVGLKLLRVEVKEEGGKGEIRTIPIALVLVCRQWLEINDCFRNLEVI